MRILILSKELHSLTVYITAFQMTGYFKRMFSVQTAPTISFTILTPPAKAPFIRVYTTVPIMSKGLQKIFPYHRLSRSLITVNITILQLQALSSSLQVQVYTKQTTADVTIFTATAL